MIRETVIFSRNIRRKGYTTNINEKRMFELYVQNHNIKVMKKLHPIVKLTNFEMRY